MGEKKRRRTDNVIQFPRDPNVAGTLLQMFKQFVFMQGFQDEGARSLLQYESEDTQTYEEFVAESDSEGVPFVDGMTEEEMRREYSDQIEGDKSFLSKIADNTSISDVDLEFIRTLLAHEFCFSVFEYTELFKRMLVHYGKFVLDLFPDHPMEEFGGLKAFQEQCELLQELEDPKFAGKQGSLRRTEFENWLKETAHKKKSSIRVLDDDDSDPDLSRSDSE